MARHQANGEITCPLKDTEDTQPDYCVFKHLTSPELIEMEDVYAAHNYHPLPVVFSEAKGVEVWDPEGKKYFDFLSAYSAVNHGHCHPKIISALQIQLHRCTLSSRAFYNDVFPRFAKHVTTFFGYDMVLPMNSGAEAVETAVKLARKWGYDKKGIPMNQAIIVSCQGCFHGRTIGILSLSSDTSITQNFGPYMTSVLKIPYNNVPALQEVLEKHGDRICGFLVEPIQGEAGVVIPSDHYLKGCAELCKKHNVLFIADEIQTGMGRTGKLLCCDWSNVRPDIVILGKAISGGTVPLSCILSDKEVMLCFTPGEHGSTFGGNPLASAVGIAALTVLEKENLVQNSAELGAKLLARLQSLKEKSPFILQVRGVGLFCAIEIDSNFAKSAWDICLMLRDRGLLCKPTHDTIIRLAPPLVITEDQLNECLQIIESVFSDLVRNEVESK